MPFAKLPDRVPVPFDATDAAEYMLPSVAGATGPHDVVFGNAFTVIVIEPDSPGRAFEVAMTVYARLAHWSRGA